MCLLYCPCHASRSSSHLLRLPMLLTLLQNPHVLTTLTRRAIPWGLPRQTTSERPKVVRTCVVFDTSSLIYPHGSAPAALASLPFNPPEQQNIGKGTVFRDFSTFSCTCIFFLLTLSLLWSSFFFSSLLWLFPPLLFHVSIILSEVWLLNFLRYIYI